MIKPILFLHHPPLSQAARNQVTIVSTRVTCWWLDGLILIKLVVSWMSSIILSTSLVSKLSLYWRRWNSTRWSVMQAGFFHKTSLWMHLLNSSIKISCLNLSWLLSTHNEWHQWSNNCSLLLASSINSKADYWLSHSF